MSLIFQTFTTDNDADDKPRAFTVIHGDRFSLAVDGGVVDGPVLPAGCRSLGTINLTVGAWRAQRSSHADVFPAVAWNELVRMANATDPRIHAAQ